MTDPKINEIDGTSRHLDGKGKQVCTKCKHQSVAGLLPGAGKCPFHWAEGVWGHEYASEVYPAHPEATAAEIKRVNGH